MSAPQDLRVYASIRTAHLERLKVMHPSLVLYNETRYDFHQGMAPEGTSIRRLGRLATVWHLLTNEYGVVELNEPLMLRRWPDLHLQVLALRLRGVFTRRQPLIVTYVLGLSDPVAELSERWHLPKWLAARVCRLGTLMLVRQMDRVAGGTEAAFGLLGGVVGEQRLAGRGRVFQPLPTRCSCAPDEELLRERPTELLFVGAFEERKGIRELMAAWELAAPRMSGARLRLIGKGTLTQEVLEWAHSRSERGDIEVVIDPPREVIHSAMRSARALALFSQRIGPWREQIGLPILEALAHGTRVVATDETGIWQWLRDRGHIVVPGRCPPSALADGIRTVLEAGPVPQEVLASLPEEDGRIAADRWLFTGEMSMSSDRPS